MTSEQKSSLRKICLERRRGVEGDAAAYAEVIAQRILPLLAGCGTVAGYAATQGEVEVTGLLKLLSSRGIITALPCVTVMKAPLIFRAWAPGQPLLSGAYEINEPLSSAAAVTPEALLVPLIAFDRRGHRLGYGGGYYDRTLAAMRDRGTLKLTIGVAYAVQEIPAVPDAAHDQLLDAIVTEKEAISIRAAG